RAQILRFLLRNTGIGEGAGSRLRRLLHIVRNGEALAQEVVTARCERGAQIATRMGFGEQVAHGVQSLDEHWNGCGRPTGLAGTAIPLAARIGLLAQVIDVFHAIGGRSAALKEIDRRAGTWFDPTLVMLFREMARDGRVWEGLTAQGLEARVAAREPVPISWTVDETRLDAITGAFADVVDAKSSFTAGHSRRVAALTDTIAKRLGFSAERRRWLTRAAHLHDLGKLGVSNAILDKPGRLDTAEWAEIRRHPALSEEILGHVGVFHELAPIAGAHHERLDGKGYPKGLAGEAIALETRVLTTADIFDAITAARPYRSAVPVGEALGMMERDRGTAVDERCLDALHAVVGSTPGLTG
ncbi:MAG: HD domain-containing phosphohydrolase, partial [Acetobacteraceae bacterium]